MKKEMKYTYKPVFAWRGLWWAFSKNWYSMFRWKEWDSVWGMDTEVKLIDIGAFSVGIRRKVKC